MTSENLGMKNWIIQHIEGIDADKAETYANALATADYTEVSHLSSITRETLIEGGFSKRHIDIILQAVKANQPVSVSTPVDVSASEFMQMKKDLALVQEDLAYLRLGRFESLSHVAVYNMIKARFGFISNDKLLWQSIPQPDEAFVTGQWAQFDTQALDGTEPTCQKVMEEFLASVLTSTHPLKSWSRIEIPNPDKSPDISITMRKDVSATWKTLLVPMEFEKLNGFKEGIGQVISYMATCLAESCRPSLLGVYSDRKTINILRVHPNHSGPTMYIHTGLLPLFPNPKPATYTDGFYALIQLLSAPLNDLYAISHPENIVVGQSTLRVDSYIADGCKTRVYKCINDKHEEVAVKTLLGGGGRDHLRTEATMLIKLAKHDPHHNYFPTLVLSDDTNLVLSPCDPYSLRTYVSQMSCNPAQAYLITEQIVVALKVAHNEAGVIHNDLRPSNITISNTDKPRIIDWGLGAEISKSQLNLFGTIAYASSKFLSCSKAVGSPATDLESVVYILLFLKLGRLPWHKAQTPKAVEDARKQLDDSDVTALLDIIATSKNDAHDKIIAYLRKRYKDCISDMYTSIPSGTSKAKK